MIHLVENSQQLTTISDMVTMATYTIRVLAFNARGDGPLSDPIQVKTQQGGMIFHSNKLPSLTWSPWLLTPSES